MNTDPKSTSTKPVAYHYVLTDAPEDEWRQVVVKAAKRWSEIGREDWTETPRYAAPKPAAPSDSEAMATQEILGWLDKVIAQKGNITVEETFDLATKVRALLASPIAPPTEQKDWRLRLTHSEIDDVRRRLVGNKTLSLHHSTLNALLDDADAAHHFARLAEHTADKEAECLRLKDDLFDVESALRPFSDEHEAKADAIGDSDLDNEQPRSVDVTLGDFRRAQRALNK